MIQLNFRDAKPIYEQIKDGIRHLIVTRGLVPEDKLPSVREMAAKLTINPNTIERAYLELEQEGYLYTVNGKGTFVSSGAQIETCRKDALMESLDEIVGELTFLAVPRETVVQRVEAAIEEGLHDSGK
ncbi:MAG: GntR family transcriptional regulator [Agathobacter sp.]|nr:GntR family transcriptional regulator [Agathobacter sp.]